jgi:hypothetical protein
LKISLFSVPDEVIIEHPVFMVFDDCGSSLLPSIPYNHGTILTNEETILFVEFMGMKA